ncbi:MAG TPA: citrate synthase [Candidatus Limnocylindrales bacterium]|nr:citrate synthase [Candidatus Limnocylindrales bacterium]
MTSLTSLDDRPYSPGLQGVLAGESSLSLVDGANGRLLYRGYPIGELVRDGSYAQVAELLWTDAWPAEAHLSCEPLDDLVLASLRDLPADAHPMDALRSAISAWGAGRRTTWPPTVDQARAITALAPSALAAFGRLRQGLEPIEPDPALDTTTGFLYQLNGQVPDEASARALDAYFIVAAEHGFNASTFTARVITSTRSDIASAVVGAVGALKGPLHGGAPSEVVSQLHEIGSAEHAEAWIADAFERGERLMGFGHRVYRAYDPRAAALREVALKMGSIAEWLSLAVAVEDIALRMLEERYPDRPLKTNVEYYTAAVLQGVGLPADLFPATFAMARTAGWTAHVLEQASVDKLIRPDVRYTGPAERSLPAT